MVELVQNNQEELRKICKDNNVAELYLFGSAVSGQFDDESDLDFAVVLNENLSPIEHGDSFFSLLFALEELFKRRIDLVSYRVIKNSIFKEELERTKLTLYAAA